MEKKNYLVYVLFLVAVFFTACGNIFQSGTNNYTFPEPEHIKYECGGNTFASDIDFIRSKGEASSSSAEIAKRRAAMDAHVNLARALENYLIRVSEYQGLSMEKDSITIEEEGGRFTRVRLDATLTHVATVCSETHESGDQYITRIIVETPVSEYFSREELIK